MSFRVKENNRASDLLSTSKNLTSPTPKMQVSTTKSSKSQKDFEQKQVLLVYVKDDRMYINRAAAYALGLTDVRTIMLVGSENLVEINKIQLAAISARDNIEVKLEKLIIEAKVPERPKIKVYRDNLDFFIEMSAAYSLGLITAETFNNMANDLYQVGDNMLVFLENKFDVEYLEKSETFSSR